jgi:hypothetical protein
MSPPDLSVAPAEAPVDVAPEPGRPPDVEQQPHLESTHDIRALSTQRSLTGGREPALPGFHCTFERW